MQRKLSALFACAAVAAWGALLATPATATDIRIDITETDHGGGVETLSVSGISGVVIGGTTDNWTLDFTATGISGFFDLPDTWVEKAGDTGFNVLSQSPTGGALLTLVSEADFTSGGSANFCFNGSPLALGVSCVFGSDANFNNYFVAINEVTAQTPEPMTLSLFGAGLGGIVAMRRRRKSKA